MITPCAIQPAAPWAALCAARSVEPPLAESWAVVEGRGGVPALVRLSAAPRAAFKGLHSTIAPMHIACVVDGRESAGGSRTAKGDSVAFRFRLVKRQMSQKQIAAARFSAAFLRQCSAFSVDHEIAGDRQCVALGR